MNGCAQWLGWEFLFHLETPPTSAHAGELYKPKVNLAQHLPYCGRRTQKALWGVPLGGERISEVRDPGVLSEQFPFCLKCSFGKCLPASFSPSNMKIESLDAVCVCGIHLDYLPT
jgi:hypothetical protein